MESDILPHDFLTGGFHSMFFMQLADSIWVFDDARGNYFWSARFINLYNQSVVCRNVKNLCYSDRVMTGVNKFKLLFSGTNEMFREIIKWGWFHS